jgi:hypothetical protein
VLEKYRCGRQAIFPVGLAMAALLLRDANHSRVLGSRKGRRERKERQRVSRQGTGTPLGGESVGIELPCGLETLAEHQGRALRGVHHAAATDAEKQVRVGYPGLFGGSHDRSAGHVLATRAEATHTAVAQSIDHRAENSALANQRWSRHYEYTPRANPVELRTKRAQRALSVDHALPLMPVLVSAQRRHGVRPS